MTARAPIPDFAALIERTAGRHGEGVHLTAEEVQTALSVLRSELDRTASAAADHRYRVESIGTDGVAVELAVVLDPILARAAYDAAEGAPGSRLILRRGAQEICSSVVPKTCVA